MPTLHTDAAFTAAEAELARLLALSPTTTADAARDQLVDAWAVQWRSILDSTPTTAVQAAVMLRAALHPAFDALATEKAAVQRVADYLAAA